MIQRNPLFVFVNCIPYNMLYLSRAFKNLGRAIDKQHSSFGPILYYSMIRPNKSQEPVQQVCLGLIRGHIFFLFFSWRLAWRHWYVLNVLLF